MKAAYYETTGGAEVIRYGELPTPEPVAGEVRVKVAAAAVNPIDVYMRSGVLKAELPKPYIPGCDLSGGVEAVGPGVTKYRVGDRVWASNQGLKGRQGTFAEFCCVPEDYLYPLPENVEWIDAAAMALVGITAHLGLYWRTNLLAGETLFVNGGTGGVGLAVVQMAKATGARVIATAGSLEKAELARKLGADVVIQYKTENVPAKVKEATGGKGIDVYFETVPPTDFDTTVEMMAPRGRIVVMAGRQARPVFPNGPFYVKCLSLFGFVMFNATAAEQQACAAGMNELMAGKKLSPIIGRVFPLSEAAAAHRLQEENTVGKAGTLAGKIVVIPGN